MRTTVILKTDIVDSTLRTAVQTQAEMGLKRKQHKRFISDIAAENEGSIFDEEGDAYWMRFPSVTTAVLAAIEMHQALRAQQTGRGEKQRLAIRAIITVGDILYEGQDTIGMSMSLTARIEKHTPPDEIYLSHAAWLILNKAEIQTSFVNELHLKGFSEPEKIYKVDHKFRTRIFTNQYIIFTDARGFTQFVSANDIEQVESFLLECDDLINDVCEKYDGVVRQVNGDQYFLTFNEYTRTMSAVRHICKGWSRILERYGIGIAIGIHKGNLNVIRSYVYGDDIHTTIYLTHFDRFYDSRQDMVWVIASNKIRAEYPDLSEGLEFQALDGLRITEEKSRNVFQQHGACRLLFHE